MISPLHVDVSNILFLSGIGTRTVEETLSLVQIYHVLPNLSDYWFVDRVSTTEQIMRYKNPIPLYHIDHESGKVWLFYGITEFVFGALNVDPLSYSRSEIYNRVRKAVLLDALESLDPGDASRRVTLSTNICKNLSFIKLQIDVDIGFVLSQDCEMAMENLAQLQDEQKRMEILILIFRTLHHFAEIEKKILP